MMTTMSSQCAGQPSPSGVATSGLESESHPLSRNSSSRTSQPTGGGGLRAADSAQIESASRAGESCRTTTAGGGGGRARVPTGGGAAAPGGAGAGTGTGAAGEGGSATYAYYVVTSDGDDYMTPNAFKIPKRSTCVTLRDVKDYFPLPGTYHFRFKVRVKEAPSGSSTEQTSSRDRLHQQPFVWLDVLEDCHLLPLYDHRIHIKATRLSWQQEPPSTEAVGIAETDGGKRGERQAAFNSEESSNTSKTAVASRQQHRVGAAAATAQQQQQEHSGASAPPNAAREQLLVGGIGEHCGGFPAPVPAPATGPLQQQQTQQPLTWVLEGERKSRSAAAAANMLLLDEDLPPSRDVREPASSAAKGPFDMKSGTSGPNLDLMF